MVLEVGLLTNTENKNKKRFGGENMIDKRKAITPLCHVSLLGICKAQRETEVTFPRLAVVPEGSEPQPELIIETTWGA